MIVYNATKQDFASDVESGMIDHIVHRRYREALGSRVGRSEQRSWQNSLTAMHLVLSDTDIPSDAGVAIELQIPQTSKRIDFIVSGQDKDRSDRAVVIELKQWESAEPTPMDAVVRSFVGGALRELPHPSYQAWSYTQLLRDFNVEVEGDIGLHACAYLHNFTATSLEDSFYAEWTDLAPLFKKGDVQRRREFIKRWVKHGDRSGVAARERGSRSSPSTWSPA